MYKNYYYTGNYVNNYNQLLELSSIINISLHLCHY